MRGLRLAKMSQYYARFNRLLKSDPRTRDIPVVLVTARDEIDDKLTGYELVGSDYIAKPVDPSFVLTVVKRTLKEK